MYQQDIDVILEAAKRKSRYYFNGPYFTGPDDKHLREALSHANPHVRKLAQQIIEIYRTKTSGVQGKQKINRELVNVPGDDSIGRPLWPSY